MRHYAIKIGTLLSLCVFLMVQPHLRGADAGKKILIAGFRSGQITNLQERMLRETIQRGFLKAGFSVVSVMEIEACFSGKGAWRIRYIKKQEILSLCKKCRARYAIYGRIYPLAGRAGRGIHQGRQYRCRVQLVDTETGKDKLFTVEAPGKKNLYDFFTELSKHLVKATVEKLKG